MGGGEYKRYREGKRTEMSLVEITRTWKGSVASECPSLASFESNLTVNMMLSWSGAPGRAFTLLPKSTEKPVLAREEWEVEKERGKWPMLVRVTLWDTTSP